MKLNSTIMEYLWDGMMLGACLVDSRGMLTKMNRAGARILGWGVTFPQNTLCHDLMECLVPAPNGGALVCPFGGPLLTEKMIWMPRTRLRRRNHTWCSVELKGMVVSEGIPLEYLLLFRDLTEEEALTEESHRLASIPEESPFPIIEVDERGTLRYANGAMIHLMEKAQIGQDGFSTALPSHIDEIAHRCLSQGHQEDNLEVQVGARQFSWTFSPHSDLGILRGYGIDVTERKKAADELSAFADTLEAKNHELDSALIKAEAATRAKAAFLATMSHEIRTPLNGVIGMAELLLNSPLDHEQQECLSIIRKAGEGLLDIINDILDFSKIESGNLLVERISFQPRQTIEEVVDLYAERAYRKGVDLVGYVNPDVPKVCLGDPHRLRQILNNFLSNALKFTSEGFVRVLVEVQPLSEAPQGSPLSVQDDSLETGGQTIPMILRFSVQDTGVGILPEAQEKIFQVFSQADSSTSRKFGGTGLGLAISRQLAELMSGSIGVSSQPEVGSTFWCALPLNVVPGDLPNVPQSRNRTVWVKSVLEGTLWALSRILEEDGIAVHPVQNLEDIVTQSRNGHLASGLLDLIVDDSVSDQSLESFCHALSKESPDAVPRVWRLQPFWVQKSELSQKKFSYETLSIPLHRDTVLRKFGKNEGGHEVAEWEKGSHVSELGPGECHGSVLKGFSNQDSYGPIILVVEDNPVNQRVARGMLSKLGCRVRICDRGDKALEILQQEAFDAVVMDWEMPVMDGLETTRAIRELEESKKLPVRTQHPVWGVPGNAITGCRLPIIGMTANVLPDDKEECLNAGMDDCLSKPAHLSDFQRILLQWVGYEGQPQGGSDLSSQHRSCEGVKLDNGQQIPPMQPKQGYEVKKALNTVEGDRELLLSLFGIFANSAPGLMKTLRQALKNEDRGKFQETLHQLKGACGALQAREATDLACRIEKECPLRPFSELKTSLERLDEEVQSLIRLWQENGGPIHRGEETVSKKEKSR